MATTRQMELRVKYAKMTMASLTKKINIAKARIKKLEGEMKKTKATAQSTAAKKPKSKKKAVAKRRR